jgi:hypothetical protein
MSLTTPLSVQKLQTALHDKAKGSPNVRFYALYDKVYREDVMAFAYECCKANRGAAGVDGQTFEDIEEYGVNETKQQPPFFCCTWPRARGLLLLLFVGDFRAASSDRSEAHGTEANDSPVQRACLATRCGRSCPMGDRCSSESRNADR